jgi:hypothetical protein
MYYQPQPQPPQPQPQQYARDSAYYESQPQDNSWLSASMPSGMVAPAMDYYDQGAVPDISSTSRRRISAPYYTQGQDMASMTPVASLPPPSIARMNTPGHSYHGEYPTHYDYSVRRRSPSGEP